MFSYLRNKRVLGVVVLIVVYLVTHLFGLLELPVFADEAIYIRWSQLILDDMPRYLFFPMNDGKTPLFFWLLAPFQFLFSDQLYAARFVSVLIGLLQMLVVMGITSKLTKSRKTIFLSGILVMIVPFWYFHHRMALTDGLMTLMISVSILFLVAEFKKSLDIKKLSIRTVVTSLTNTDTIRNLVIAGLFFGLALFSKIPAILFVPSLFLLIFFTPKKSFNTLVVLKIKVLCVLGIGLAMFASLMLVPSFSQLFGRGSDFLFPLSEILAGKWKDTVPSLPVYFGYFFTYMTPTLMILMFMGLFARKNKSIVHIFFWSGILFILPIGIMGKMAYARYFFPAVIYFTLASVFAIEDLFVWSKKFTSNSILKLLWSSFLVLLVANTVATSGVFMATATTESSKIPFVSSDITQYLAEWSSGHGLYETAQMIQQESKVNSIAVATEGSFGTLPDGLNLYFHNRDVSNIAIDGVGYPVKGITNSFAQTARNFDRKWLVINSHRLDIPLDEKYLLSEFCRPFDAPCLQVWDITEVFESLVLD